MKVRGFSVGPLQENCYLVVDEESSAAALVDPGDEAPRLLRAIEQAGVTLQAIWITHAHFDHIGAVAEIVRQTGVPVWLHPKDLPIWNYAEKSASAYGLRLEQPAAPDHQFADTDEVTLGSLRFRVFHAPGHAPGHVVLHGHGVPFVGDCLFAGSIGRTDLPMSHPASLAASLQRIAELPNETVVYSGHGPVTTIGEEKESNPFLNGMARVVGA